MHQQHDQSALGGVVEVVAGREPEAAGAALGRFNEANDGPHARCEHNAGRRGEASQRVKAVARLGHAGCAHRCLPDPGGCWTLRLQRYCRRPVLAAAEEELHALPSVR